MRSFLIRIPGLCLSLCLSLALPLPAGAWDWLKPEPEDPTRYEEPLAGYDGGSEAGQCIAAILAAEQRYAIPDHLLLALGLQGQMPMQKVVEATMAMESALKVTVALRDRVVEAYQEVMRMSV